jgi:tetratricopeptide (TPR) repeat protein
VLSRLVDRSLVTRVQARDGKARYRLLETLRTFALQLLRDSNELPSLRSRYATHYLERLRAAEASVEGPQQAETLDCLEQDIDNIRAALDWSVDSDDAEPALRGAWSLAVLGWLRGYLQEVDTRLAPLLDSASGRNAAPEVRAGGQVALGYVCFYRGQLERAHELIHSGLRTFRQLRRSQDTARALVWYGLILDTHSRLRDAQACFIEALQVFRNNGDEFWTARAATNLGRCLARRHLHWQPPPETGS